MPPSSADTIGARLRSTRERRMLTQQELAERSGVPVVTISRIENNQQRTESYASTLKKLAAALDADAAWLRFGDGGS